MPNLHRLFGGLWHPSLMLRPLRGSDNRRVSGSVPSALCPNAFAKFITVKLFSDTMSEGTSDARKPLSEMPKPAVEGGKKGEN